MHVTPQQAAALVQEGAVYLDVRTPEEFEEGHPPAARNIPLQVRDPLRGLVDNPAFVDDARALLAAERTLIVGCRSGPRADRAALLLRAAGFTRVQQMQGGMEGRRDAFGALQVPGWKQCDLPVSYDDTYAYEKLRRSR